MKAPSPPLFYRVTHAVTGPLMKSLGLSCETFHHLAAGAMDRQLSIGETIRYRAHMAMCGICRRLPGQFRRLRELVRRVEAAGESGHVHGDCDCTHEDALSADAKAHIADCLRQSRPERRDSP